MFKFNERANLAGLALAAILCFLLIKGAHARQPVPGDLNEKRYHLSVLGGYGTSHRGMGRTRAHVQTIDYVLRYGRFLTCVLGDSWYQGRHELLIELPVHLVVDPDVSPMVGFNVLACQTFTASKQFIPYIIAGGGILYTDAKIPGLGSKLNGNYQFGAGIYYPVGDNHYLNFEYRFHHISNAGTKEPNDPMNSSKWLIGLTVFY